MEQLPLSLLRLHYQISLYFTMPYRILLFLYRKDGSTPSQFRDYCETKHIPFLQSLAGETFPRLHSRRYIDRQPTPASMENAGSQADIDYPATELMGPRDFVEYDCIVEHVHESQDAFKAFYSRMVLDEDVAATLAADEAVFLNRDKTKAVVIGEMVETKK